MTETALQTLAKALSAAGYHCSESHGILRIGRNTRERYYECARVSLEDEVYTVGKIDWFALDIIRRHVAPAPPVVLTAAEREGVGRFLTSIGLWDELGPWDYSKAPEEFDEVIDALIAWLAANGFTITREARS